MPLTWKVLRALAEQAEQAGTPFDRMLFWCGSAVVGFIAVASCGGPIAVVAGCVFAIDFVILCGKGLAALWRAELPSFLFVPSLIALGLDVLLFAYGMFSSPPALTGVFVVVLLILIPVLSGVAWGSGREWWVQRGLARLKAQGEVARREYEQQRAQEEQAKKDKEEAERLTKEQEEQEEFERLEHARSPEGRAEKMAFVEDEYQKRIARVRANPLLAPEEQEALVNQLLDQMFERLRRIA